METRLPCRPTRGSLTSPSYLARNRTLGPPLENNPEPPPSSRLEGLRTEICDLIKIRMRDDDFYYKSSQIIILRDIDSELSKLDLNEQKEALEKLKIDDKKLYDEFTEWKKNK